jgi:insulysin
LIISQTISTNFQPEEYIVNLVGHEGPGSILAELKARGWSSSLNCEHIKYANGFGFFEIKVDLSDMGYENMDKIVKLIFQYLSMIKERGTKEWLFEEYRNLREIEFRFEDEKSPVGLVRRLVSSMRHYPLNEVLSAPVLVSEWRPDLIKFVLDMLTPKNLRVMIVDHSCYWKCMETEKIYGTRFGTEPIPPSIIRDWTLCGSDPSLKLPQPNLFIPNNFEFLPIDNWTQTYPKIIRDSSLIRVWFKQDTEFRKPKSIMTIELKNPTIHCDPTTWNLTHMFVWLLEDHLKEHFYVAELAGIECRISVTTSGIRIHIEGFSQKQPIFLETILQEIFRFKVTQRRYESTYDSYWGDLKSVKDGRPQHIAIYYLGVVLTEQMWTNEELIQSMKFITMRRLQTFIKEVLSQTHAECFIFGNVNEEKAFELSALVEDRLNKAKTCNLSKASMIFILASLTMRERVLPEGRNALRMFFVKS